MIRLLIGLLILSISACTNKALYQALMDNEKHQCLTKAINNSDYDQCLNSSPMDYKEYQFQRDEVITSEKEPIQKKNDD